MTNWLKKLLPDVLAIVAFILISYAYFYPAVFDGRVLEQHDSIGGAGAGREISEYYQKTGETTRWTNTLFSGMPTYQIGPRYDSLSTLSTIGKWYSLYLPTYVNYLFLYLLGFYILMRAFNFRPWMASLGAIVWAFSSYFFIIISAGHIWKVMTLAYIPPTIAGMVLIYKRKYVLGGALTALFAGLQLASNHIQMTYYFLFVMLFMFIAYGEQAWKEKQMPHFLRSTAVLIVAGLMGAALNLSNLYHTYQYSKESMRGKSELVKPASTDGTAKASNGLEREYITQWSYGIGETWSLLIPNVKGGASVPLSENSTAMAKANPTYAGLYSQIGQYWGEQPGTSGPVYVGAFVLFLFLLGCFIVEGPLKWALLGGTLFSILLSWGKNFMGLTDFFIDYVPLYNKFRTVSSILVIAEFTIPLLAMLTLKQVVERPEILKEKLKQVVAAFALTGGAALLFAVAPHLFFGDFISSAEMAALQNGIPAEHLAAIITNLNEMRTAMFTADAWRSLLVVAFGCVALAAFYFRKIDVKILLIVLTILCIGDMWTVNKRYLYDGQFVKPGEKLNALMKPSPTNETIMKDKTLDYRVLNLASNTFNENETSLFHNSIGGYHAAKLRRYQELIEAAIQPEMQELFKRIPEANGDMTKVDATAIPVLNMLNTRYFIFPLEGGQTAPIQNPYCLGNAWFVDEVNYVNNANEELEAVKTFHPRRTAVVDKRFAEVIGQATPDSTATIRMTAYTPNRLTYETQATKNGVVVFSEIFYPGWTATIDGKTVELGRADYVLRAMQVPAGKHQIVLTFDPQSIHTTETVAYIALGLLLLGLIFTVVTYVMKGRKQ